jgi:hypothetical protein
MIPAPPAWLPRIHQVQAKAQILNSAELLILEMYEILEK